MRHGVPARHEVLFGIIATRHHLHDPRLELGDVGHVTGRNAVLALDAGEEEGLEGGVLVEGLVGEAEIDRRGSCFGGNEAAKGEGSGEENKAVHGATVRLLCGCGEERMRIVVVLGVGETHGRRVPSPTARRSVVGFHVCIFRNSQRHRHNKLDDVGCSPLCFLGYVAAGCGQE